MREQRIDRSWQKALEPIDAQGGVRYVLSIERETIPVVFIPGIMGTRLRRADGVRLWDPDSPIFMLRKYGAFWIDAEKRQKNLFGDAKIHQPGYAVVHEDHADHNKKIEKRFKGASRRGWGGVAWSSYAAILGGLEQARWSPFISRCFDLPVYACGYDWQGSCADAGAHLAARVRQIKSEVGGPCKQVILVTHSMGGLVARSACHDHGLEPEVLGVVHTVQPAAGAPAAYWRMKAGFERHRFIDPVPWVLGTDGQEVTSLLCNMAGGLQLLPNKLYRDNAGSDGWLRYVEEGSSERRLPERGDPYGEIYANDRDLWRLVQWKDFIIARDRGEATTNEIATGWNRYLAKLRIAKRFHDKLRDYRHPLSHHVYGTGSATADTVTLTLGTKSILAPPRADPPVERLEHRGKFRHFFGTVPRPDGRTARSHCLEMGDPEGDGDGTVPTSSATLLVGSKGGGKRLVFGGRDFEQTGTEAKNYEHESVFKDGPDGVNTVIKAIQALCALKIEHEMER